MITPMKFKIDRNSTTYLNTKRFYSDPMMWLFLLTGGRGIGKTTNLTADAISDFMKNGNEFAYVRRYKTELAKCKELLQPIVSETDTKAIGNGIFQYQCHKVRIGYGLALSLQASFKSGVDFSKVSTLIFDEAILMPGSSRYLPNEVTMFLELLSTVFRTRKNYRVFILGNNADLFNPYNAYFNIPRFTDVYKDRARGIWCENLKHSASLLLKEEETPLHRLTADTDYGRYHYDNEVFSDVKCVVGLKPKNAVLMFRIVYNDFTLNIYRVGIIEMYVELREKVIKDSISYVMYEDNKPNYLSMEMMRNDDARFFLRQCYYNGKVIYNDKKAGTIMSLIMNEI